MDEEIPAIPAIRTCLKCNKQFKSKSSGNRICNYCRDYKDRSIHLVPVPSDPPVKKGRRRCS